jgi:Flp pilus assembly protein TadG
MRVRRADAARAARRGVTTVEAALVITVFFMFLFGIFEYARYIFVLQAANNAVRDGARYAVVRTNIDGTTAAAVETDIRNLVEERMGPSKTNLEPASYTFEIFLVDSVALSNTPPVCQPASGRFWYEAGFAEKIAVRVRGDYKPSLPSLLFMSETIPVSATAVMGSEAN